MNFSTGLDGLTHGVTLAEVLVRSGVDKVSTWEGIFSETIRGNRNTRSSAEQF